MILDYVAVGIGGFLGAILRYIARAWVQRIGSGESGFPLGTLAVNLMGCLIMGALGGLAESREIFSQQVRLCLFMGFLGSFTTFSTFSYETLTLLKAGHFIEACASVLLHVIVGLAAVWAGYALTTFP